MNFLKDSLAAVELVLPRASLAALLVPDRAHRDLTVLFAIVGGNGSDDDPAGVFDEFYAID